MDIDEDYAVSAAPNSDAAKNGRALALKKSFVKLHSSEDGSIENRQVLEAEVARLDALYQDQQVPCPEHWGGYLVAPYEIDRMRPCKTMTTDFAGGSLEAA